MHAHTLKYTNTYAHTNTHTHTHTHTQTYIHTRTRTNKYTHIRICLVIYLITVSTLSRYISTKVFT